MKSWLTICSEDYIHFHPKLKHCQLIFILNRLHFHYENLLCQNLLLKFNYANIMKVLKLLCKICHWEQCPTWWAKDLVTLLWFWRGQGFDDGVHYGRQAFHLEYSNFNWIYGVNLSAPEIMLLWIVDHHWDYNTIPSVIYHDWIWFCFVSQLAFALGGYNVYGNSPWCPTTVFSHFSLFWWRGKWLWCPSSVQTVLLAGWDKGCTFSLHPHNQYSFSISLVERTF